MNTTNQRKECECDDCGNETLCSTNNGGKIWLCATCRVKEEQALANTTIINSPTSEEERLARYAANPFGNKPRDVPEGAMAVISVNEILKTTGQDTTIRISTDIFNAKTASIVNDIKAVIDSDPAIENKPYALAETLKNRFVALKTVIFDANQALIDAGNEQRAIQVYLNVLANQLRQEEREKLKIADINYKPQAPKIAKPKIAGEKTQKVKPIKVAGTKIDKRAVRSAAAALGINDFTLSTIMMAHDMTVNEAVAYFKSRKPATKVAE